MDNLQAVMNNVLSGYLELDDPGTEDDPDAEGETDNEIEIAYNDDVDLINTKADEGDSNDNIQNQKIDERWTKRRSPSKKLPKKGPAKKATPLRQPASEIEGIENEDSDQKEDLGDYGYLDNESDDESSEESGKTPITSNLAIQESTIPPLISTHKHKRGRPSQTSASSDEWSIAPSPPKKKKQKAMERKELPENGGPGYFARREGSGE